MKPVKFEEMNKTLSKPDSMTEEECGSLHIWNDGIECISCWELSEAEIMEVVNTGRIWARVYSGKTQPPISIQADSPFRPASETPDLIPKESPRPLYGDWVNYLKRMSDAIDTLYAYPTLDNYGKAIESINPIQPEKS